MASPLDRYRIAFASCQHYEQGYFSAYRAMREDAPDLVLFLGDYIYESDWGSDRIRRHHGPEPVDLAGYRTRHAQYKLDADLRAAHAELPFCFTWDDHEVDNDYAGDVSENLDPGFLLRRAAAYQAFFEHLPLPRRMYPRGPNLRLYTAFDVGDLLRVYLLDDRQYRTPQPCPRPNRHGSQTLVGCTELEDPRQTLLGAEQEGWFAQACADSRARWNLVGQQTLVAPRDAEPGPARSVSTDGWDGYPLARQRLLDSLRRVRNPVIAGGDLHAAIVASVPSDPRRLDSRVLASEFVTTSISSEGWPQSHYERSRADNPHIHHARSDQRGYTLLEFGRAALEASVRVVDDVRSAKPGFATQARFRVEDGRPGPEAI
jgi:alkaline phosphatase D